MLEELFTEVDAALAGVDGEARRAAKFARAAAGAARSGEVARLRRSLDGVAAALPQLSSAVQAAQERLNRLLAAVEQAPETIRAEVEQLATARGLPWQQTDRASTVVVFPVVVMFSGDSVRLDHKPFRSQRPSAIVAGIEQARGRFREDASTASILRTLFRATLYASGQAQRKPGARDASFSAEASAVYEILSLNNPEYTPADFTRHLYLLDRQVTNVIEGYRLSLPASTGTRSRGTFRIFGPDGYEHVYYAIKFERSPYG